MYPKEYYEAIKLCLPWTSDFNEKKSEPYDMELRDLVFKADEINLSESDRELVKTLKYFRNQLAHNHALLYEEICWILIGRQEIM